MTDSFSLRKRRTVTENLITSHRPVMGGSGFWIKTEKMRFHIETTNGASFAIKKETYHDHYGVSKKVWLMQWIVTGERTEIVIRESE